MIIDVRGPDGNVFAIMGYVSQLLKKSGRGNEVERVHKDMMSGDYQHALRVAEKETYGAIKFEGEME